jgi:hypothetical protein
MAKIKYDVSDVEPSAGFKLPKPGVYTCKLIACVDESPEGKDRRLAVQYEITDGEFKGFKIYDYINLVSEAAKWKQRQFYDALGLPPKGTLDPDKVVGTALSVKVKIQPETEQYSASAKAALLMPLDGEEEEGEDLDDESESAEDVDDADETDATAEDDGDEGGDEDEDDELWTEEELNDLEDDDLLLYAYGGTDEDDDEIEGLLEEDDEETGRDVFVTETTKGKGKTKKTVTTVDRENLIAAMLAAQEEEGDEDEPPDYDSMEPAELQALCKERKLPTKGTKKVLIARLKKDDQPF